MSASPATCCCTPLEIHVQGYRSWSVSSGIATLTDNRLGLNMCRVTGCAWTQAGMAGYIWAVGGSIKLQD